MKKDKLGIRYASIAVSESNNETYGRKVVVRLDSIKPNVIVTKDGKYENLQPLVTKLTNVLPVNTNILVDIENEDRFKFIGVVNSPLTDNSVGIYYDDKFKDMFVIPSLNSVGIEDDVRLYENSGIEVIGHRLFGRGLDNIYVDDLSLPIKDDNAFVLNNIPKRLNTTKAFVVYTGMNSNNTGLDMLGDDGGDRIIYDKSRLPICYIDLGDVNDVFDEDVSLPTFNTLDMGVGMSKLHYLGNVKRRRITFPITF